MTLAINSAIIASGVMASLVEYMRNRKRTGRNLSGYEKTQVAKEIANGNFEIFQTIRDFLINPSKYNLSFFQTLFPYFNQDNSKNVAKSMYSLISRLKSPELIERIRQNFGKIIELYKKQNNDQKDLDPIKASEHTLKSMSGSGNFYFNSTMYSIFLSVAFYLTTKTYYLYISYKEGKILKEEFRKQLIVLFDQLNNEIANILVKPGSRTWSDYFKRLSEKESKEKNAINYVEQIPNQINNISDDVIKKFKEISGTYIENVINVAHSNEKLTIKKILLQIKDLVWLKMKLY